MTIYRRLTALLAAARNSVAAEPAPCWTEYMRQTSPRRRRA